jgi:hypothetical protein
MVGGRGRGETFAYAGTLIEVFVNLFCHKNFSRSSWKFDKEMKKKKGW